MSVLENSTPRVETQRLVLRAPRASDFPTYVAMWGDPHVVRHITGEPLSEEAAWAKFLRDAGHWALLGYGFWVIADKESDTLVGQCGFADFKRALDPPFGDAREMGWALAAAAHGKGIGAEAIAGALGWGRANLSGKRIVCMINEENEPSIRVASKSGFVEYARAAYHGKAVILMEA